MHIGVIGATGTIGSRVVTEALGRGHHVTALSRDASGIEESRANVTWASVDVLDPASIAAVLPGLDVLISGFQPGNAAKDFADTVRRSIADPTVHVTAARALVKALERHPRTRLLVIGGAGSLETEPGVVLADDEDRMHATLDEIGLPREYAVAARGARDGLDVLRTSNRLWTYFSPAEDIAPGERTGRFRIGGDQVIRDADGRSHVSAEDAAVAIVDEVELPRFVQRRFTIGY
ncbi:NAD(P)H-binding protein [Streptomyces sp. HU2014]|uniref:Epimerase n=1 Tax=Streptomyces albireticuli TaxID=1940 RepID=A0A1Z2LD76_9ACTN|nr:MULTISPECIES: NAD(P)H-binding protein [Streptomyces]ARZ72244.1 epimerase [Streptomyces albireticuli]UQI45610.1 NAD(P)H-binding protein [Streptomyces sp. HU2014]